MEEISVSIYDVGAQINVEVVGAGPTGPKGPAGYTPVRGVDYWTETDKTEIVKEAIAALQSRIRKDYINRNYYVDKDTNIPVLQVVNSETGRVIGQYPADMYLNLIMRVRENQKSMVSQQSMETQQTITNQINVTNQQANIEQQLMANQKS